MTGFLNFFSDKCINLLHQVLKSKHGMQTITGYQFNLSINYSENQEAQATSLKCWQVLKNGFAWGWVASSKDTTHFHTNISQLKTMVSVSYLQLRYALYTAWYPQLFNILTKEFFVLWILDVIIYYWWLWDYVCIQLKTWERFKSIPASVVYLPMLNPGKLHMLFTGRKAWMLPSKSNDARS